MALTYSEVEVILDMKYVSTSCTRYVLQPRIYEVSDINLELKSLHPDNVEVKIAIDDIRLKSNLTTNETLRFTKILFFYTILGFTQSHSGVLGDIEGFVQLMPGSYKVDKPSNITGNNEVHLKCDGINGSFLNGVRSPILFSVSLKKPLAHETHNEPGVKFF